MTDRPRVKRATISWDRRAQEGLEFLTERWTVNQNDAANRAVRIAAYIEEELARGKSLYIGDEGGDGLERIRLL